MEKEISLYFSNGTSDKEYHVQLQSDEALYVVNFQYGRRGRKLNTGTKTQTAVSLEKANKIYDKLVKSKLSKGYTEGILRNATCGTYTVTWDVNRDGVFNDSDNPRNVSPWNNTVYDIGRTYQVPAVDFNKTLPIDLEV